MGLFSKIKAKHKEEKKAYLKQEYPAVYVNMCFLDLADLFAEKNGAFSGPMGRIDFWTYLYWFSRDIINEAVSNDYFVACFCTHLDTNESHPREKVLSALEHMRAEEKHLDDTFESPASGDELMVFCGHAIETLYNQKSATLAIEFAQYLARSAQIVCEAFPKNK